MFYAKRMNRPFLRILLVVMAQLFVAGCATNPNGQPIGMLTTSKVTQLGFGTSREQVLQELGKPNSSNSRLTASGTEEVFIYSKGDLLEKFEGGAAAFKWGMQRGLSGGSGATFITLRFLDGRLNAIEGL